MESSLDVEKWIPEIVERLRPFDPVKIILFGSRARGDANRHSDVDLVVVLPRVDGRRELELEMSRALAGLRLPNDVFVTDLEEVARTGDSVGSFLHPVLREGRVIYGVDDRGPDVWMRYAEEDLATAERMLEGQGFAFRWACYLAQQAAEKALKAVLVEEAIRFPFVHELDDLRDLVPRSRRVAQVRIDLRWLSKWAMAARYPDVASPATEEDAREAVAAARAIVDAAKQDLTREG